MSTDFLMSNVPALFPEAASGTGEALPRQGSGGEGGDSALPLFGSLFQQAAEDLESGAGEMSGDGLPPAGNPLPPLPGDQEEGDAGLSDAGLENSVAAVVIPALEEVSGSGPFPVSPSLVDGEAFVAGMDSGESSEPFSPGSERMTLLSGGSEPVTTGLQRERVPEATGALAEVPARHGAKGAGMEDRGSGSVAMHAAGQGASGISGQVGAQPAVPAIDSAALDEEVTGPGFSAPEDGLQARQTESRPGDPLRPVGTLRNTPAPVAGGARNPQVAGEGADPYGDEAAGAELPGFGKTASPPESTAASAAVSPAVAGQVRRPGQVVEEPVDGEIDVQVPEMEAQRPSGREKVSVAQASPAPAQTFAHAGRVRLEKAAASPSRGAEETPAASPGKVHHPLPETQAAPGMPNPESLAADGGLEAMVHSALRPGPQGASAAPPSTGAPAGAVSPGSAEIHLDEPLGHENWEKSMARQLFELSEKGEQRATLRLNPANLGSLDVHIATEEGEARIRFSSHHAAVREAVEAALPRLREMFQGSGVDLVQVDVSRRDTSAFQQSQGGDPGQDQHRGSSRGAGGFEEAEPLSPAISPTVSNRLIDYYA